MQYIVRTFAFLSLVVFLNGCTTMADSISAKGTGQFRVYEKPYATVWNAVLDVLITSELQLVTENKGSGQINIRF